MAAQFTESFTVTDVTAYPTDPQVDEDFVPEFIIFQNTGDGGVFFSFDGTNDAGWTGAGMSLSIPCTRSGWLYRKVWLRAESTADDSAICRVSLYG